MLMITSDVSFAMMTLMKPSWKKTSLILIAGLAVFFLMCLLTEYGRTRYIDVLSYIAVVTSLCGFSFLHTLLGHNASLGKLDANSYSRVKSNIRYGQMEKGPVDWNYIIAGVLEFAVCLIMIMTRHSG